MGGTLWYQTHTFKALWQTSVLTVLYWLPIAVSTNNWDWKNALLPALLGNVTKLCLSMFDKDVVGVFPFMNRNAKP